LQVRDILHVDDAVAAYRRVLDRIEALKGRAFNLGGGPRNAVTLRLVLDAIESEAGRRSRIDFSDWRQGDQLYFVADTARLAAATGWSARIGWREGVADLARWLRANRDFPALQPERIRA
jgi:CDP-paratose 2-epimerase